MAAKGVKRTAERQFVKIVRVLDKAPNKTMTREALLAAMAGSGWVEERLSTYLWNARKSGFMITTANAGRGKVSYTLTEVPSTGIPALPDPDAAKTEAPAVATAPAATEAPKAQAPPPSVAPKAEKPPKKADAEKKIGEAGKAAGKAAAKLKPETKKAMDKIADDEIPAALRRA